VDAVAMAARGELLRGGSVLRWWEAAMAGSAALAKDDDGLCVCVRESHALRS
jgi:hypothetical protein